MKKILLVLFAAVFALTAFVSCNNGNTDDTKAPNPDNTSSGSETKGDTEAPINIGMSDELDEFLSGYTIYRCSDIGSVIDDDDRFNPVYNQWKAGEEIPEEYAISFPNNGEFAMVLTTESEGSGDDGTLRQFVKGVWCFGGYHELGITVEYDSSESFELLIGNDYIVVGGLPQSGSGYYGNYTVFSMNDILEIVSGDAEDDFVYQLSEDDGEIEYVKTKKRYAFAEREFSALAESFVSADDFFYEEGVVSEKNGEAESGTDDMPTGENWKLYLKSRVTRTFEEWYESADDYPEDDYREIMDKCKTKFSTVAEAFGYYNDFGERAFMDYIGYADD